MSDNELILHKAVQENNIANVKALLAIGINVNAQNKNGFTALHIAAECGNVDIIEILHKSGADPSIGDMFGNTALHISCQKNDRETARALLNHGSGSDYRNQYWQTPLHLAVENNNEEIVGILLDRAANLDFQDFWGDTVFNSCLKKNRIRMAEVLIEWHGCNMISNDTLYRIFNITLLRRKTDMILFIMTYLILRNVKISCDSAYLKEFVNFQNDCLIQLEAMKETKICSSNISFYDVLTKHPHATFKYARNENFVEILQSDFYKTKFPIYEKIMCRNFHKGMILSTGDSIAYLGIVTDETIMRLSSIDCPDGSFVLDSEGKIKVDGLSKSTLLPKFEKGSKIAFSCDCIKDDKVVIHIDLNEKRVTYEWGIDKKRSFHFAAELPSPAWKVMVE